jgi:metallo-beta-lactamase class B
MKRAACIAALSVACMAASCAASMSQPPEIRTEKLGPDLQLVKVTDVVWIHISEDETDRWGTMPANGLLLVGEKSSVLVDTGWKPAQTARILEFAEKTLNAPVRRVVITHAHSDRIGGLEAISSTTAQLYAHELTAKKLAKLAPDLKVETFDEEMHFSVGNERVELYYPGPGHTRDNSVVWLPDSKILFAGCIVKSGRSAGLGNVEDAILADWPASLFHLLSRYAGAELVIPGHGPPGRVELLHHTIALLEQDMSVPTEQ